MDRGNAVAVVTVDETRHGTARSRQAHELASASFSPQSSPASSPGRRLPTCIIASAPAPPYHRRHGLPHLSPAASPRSYKRSAPRSQLSTHLASPLLPESPSHLAAPHCPPQLANCFLAARAPPQKLSGARRRPRRRRCPVQFPVTVCLHREAKLMGRGAYTRMEGANTKFYQLGNGGSLVFERDLDALSDLLDRPHPEFYGTEVHDQPGGELQWVITADLRGKMEPPTSERILFSIRESNWLDGLARALQEALARLCGQHVTELQGTHFAHFARHDTIGGPMALSSHPVLKYHVEHLDFMLHETQKELDNSRVYTNQTHLHLAQHAEAIKMLAKDRKSLRLQRAKKDATIARLRAKIVSLEATVKAQEDQLREMEEEGEDLQGGEAFMSDDEDFEGDEFTDEEDYEFLEAGEDGFIPIDVDDEE
ncbi:hypothetical protein QYE76_048798 [Lolium multiflorum]|uniref:Uncharacterized protein n=1 Tax=Lolium multiflorum TaxID=4521 RepID=A0AAD8WFQ6_LOLMU|nr:hypothetical protein QYE76_048798 [Lolium multiflorum]